MDWNAQWLIGFLFSMVTLSGESSGLDCWLCIAEDCDKPPDGNIMASRRRCDREESCQKVYYKAYDYKKEKIYESTTRSCSYGVCVPRDDFVNCTNDMLHNPGCVRHECCKDRDMCNSAPAQTEPCLMCTAVTLVICACAVLHSHTRTGVS